MGKSSLRGIPDEVFAKRNSISSQRTLLDPRLPEDNPRGFGVVNSPHSLAAEWAVQVADPNYFDRCMNAAQRFMGETVEIYPPPAETS